MPSREPLRLNGATFNRDKTGLVRVVVPWEVYTLADCDHFTPNEEIGLPITDRSAEEFEVGTWRLLLTYEGLVQEPEPEDENSIEVSFQGNMSQDPIRSHHNFAFLKKKYGWEKIEGGSYGFPELLPASGTGSNPHGGGGTKTKLSDVHGTEAWLVAEGVFTATYTTRNPPGDLMDGVGTAVGTPRHWRLLGIPVPRGRNFLKQMPDLDRRGSAVRVTEKYRMSGPKGINRDIYNTSQINTGSSSGGGGGLQTGGLQTGSL